MADGQACKCSRDKEITETHKICKRLDDALRGNGKPGLFTQFAVLKNTVAGLIVMNLIIITAIVSLWIKGM